MTIPLPKSSLHTLLTATREVNGLSLETIQRAKPSLFFGKSSGKGVNDDGVLDIVYGTAYIDATDSTSTQISGRLVM